MRLRLLALLPLVALLAACGGAPAAPPPSPTPSASASAGRPEMAQLVGGFWRVRADGEPADSWVRFGGASVDLFRLQGRISGAFAAQGDRLLVGVYGWSESLGDDRAAPWLTGADRVERDGDGWVLRDPEGAEVARLRRDGRPAPSSQYETDPTPAGPGASALRDAVPGPDVQDVAAAAVRGEWHLGDRREVVLRLGADGTWTARTSCESGTGANGGGGAYRLLPGGMLLITAGPSALIGCSEPRRPSKEARAVADFWQARSVSVRDGRMTLFDAAGRRIGEVVR